ncbi:MAG: MBL fold metallo-hydrolase [Bacteroidales bacterium]|nr:MBL fold metallo-hydrolase [Bacteroidales bacterium]
MCLGSGSSGNCYYLGTDRYAILIDAGIAGRTIRSMIKKNGLSNIPVRALLITHSHADHIRGASMVSSLMGCPVYATEEVHKGMDNNYGQKIKISTANRRYVNIDEQNDIPLTGFRVTPFIVPHDSKDNVGYYIEWEDGGEHERICLVTDAGLLTPDIRQYVSRAEHLIVESNHDVDMLMKGPYPYFLKVRVRGEGGHLSNGECAQLLRETYHEGVLHVFLCHLSDDNNTPQKAYDAASKGLVEAGAQVGYGGVTLVVLQRTEDAQKADALQVYELSKAAEARQLTIDF